MWYSQNYANLELKPVWHSQKNTIKEHNFRAFFMVVHQCVRETHHNHVPTKLKVHPVLFSDGLPCLCWVRLHQLHRHFHQTSQDHWCGKKRDKSYMINVSIWYMMNCNAKLLIWVKDDFCSPGASQHVEANDQMCCLSSCSSTGSVWRRWGGPSLDLLSLLLFLSLCCIWRWYPRLELNWYTMKGV